MLFSEQKIFLSYVYKNCLLITIHSSCFFDEDVEDEKKVNKQLGHLTGRKKSCTLFSSVRGDFGSTQVTYPSNYVSKNSSLEFY